MSGTRKVGRRAEWLALLYLRVHGLSLVARNYNTRLGEVDLIMLDRAPPCLTFVEVRYRAHKRFGSGAATVTQSKRARIIRAAKLFLQRHRQYRNLCMRFDVVSISQPN